MTYEYECKEKGCRATFAIQQSIKEDPLTKCLSCGGKMSRVVTGGSGFLLKTGGFYTTDNRRKEK